MINGFLDIEYRLEQLSKCGDPLVKLKEIVPWTSFRSELSKIHDKERKSTAGRKPYDTDLMFKILILQSLYNLSDEAMEYQVRTDFPSCVFLIWLLKTLFRMPEQYGFSESSLKNLSL